MFKNIKTPEELKMENSLNVFRSKRQTSIDKSVVTISTGKTFDADEKSIIRLCNAVVRSLTYPDDYIIPWSTSDVGTGIMVPCTKLEILEAHKLATDNFEKLWGLENN